MTKLYFLLSNGFVHVQTEAGECGVFQIDWMLGHRNMTLGLSSHAVRPVHAGWVEPCQETGVTAGNSFSMCTLEAGHEGPHQPHHASNACPWCNRTYPDAAD